MGIICIIIYRWEHTDRNRWYIASLLAREMDTIHHSSKNYKNIVGSFLGTPFKETLPLLSFFHEDFSPEATQKINPWVLSHLLQSTQPSLILKRLTVLFTLIKWDKCVTRYCLCGPISEIVFTDNGKFPLYCLLTGAALCLQPSCCFSCNGVSNKTIAAE